MKNKNQKDSLRNSARDARAQGAYYQIKKADFQVMSRDSAFFIAFLAELERYGMKNAKDKGQRFNGWMYCTVPYTEKKIKVGRWVQARIIKELIEKGFIKVRLEGSPQKRWFYVYWERIEEAVQNKEQEEFEDVQCV